MTSRVSPRVVLVVSFLLLAYFLITVRLFYWQVVRHQEIKKIAERQSQESLLLPAKRGDIASSDAYPLATNTISYLLFGNPKEIGDKKGYARQLSKILSIEQSVLEELFSKDLYWVKIKDGLDSSLKTQIEQLNLAGIDIQKMTSRFYPEASMAAQLLGFVGRNEEGEDKGYFGLEGFYNDQLSGRSGRLFVVRDAFGNPVLNDIREEEKIDGRTLILTIDRTIQYFVEKRLEEGLRKFGADGGSVVVIAPKTGKIYAMASFPRFAPQTYYEYETATYKNPVISSAYELGSTFKVLVMSSAIDLGLVKPDTVCTECAGPVSIGGYTIRTWNDKYYPESTMREVIQHSDNIGMVFVGKKLGLTRFLSYLARFGIGEKTHIDLQGEINPELKKEKEWYEVDLAAASFGQGISVTPLQLLVGVSAIANGGNVMRPYVVSQIVTEAGKKIDIQPKFSRRAIKESTARTMTEMMVNAVERGEAKWTKIKNYKIAGKTGTAQIPVAGHYDPERTIASFVGFFPADEAQIAMLVLVDGPKTSPYGSETAAPIFFSIAKDLIHYYNIPPSY